MSQDPSVRPDLSATQLALYSLTTGLASGLVAPSVFGFQAFFTAFSAGSLVAGTLGLVHRLATQLAPLDSRKVSVFSEWARRGLLIAPALVFLSLVASRGGLGVTWSIPLALVVLLGCSWAALRQARRFFALSPQVAAVAVIGCFFWMHLRTGTLLDIKPGTESVHVAFYAVSVLGSTSLAQLAAGYAPTRGYNAAGFIWALLLAILGIALLRLDAAFLVGNYPVVHLSLWGLGLLSVMSGLIAWPQLPAWLLRRKRLEGAIYLVVLMLGSSLVLFSQSTSLAARQGMANSSVGRLLLGVFPYSFSRQFATSRSTSEVATQNLEEFTELRGRYNILLITLDGMRADHLTPSITPELSRLAQESARFEYSYAQGSKTLIGLTALLSGRYSAHTPWVRISEPGQRSRWFPNLESGLLLQERVKTHGYFTLACLEGGGDDLFARDSIFARGFDEYVDLSDLKKHPEVSKHAAERAIEQRRKFGEKKFFQWIHLMDPHRSFKSDRYRELVSSSDAAIGAILQSLRDDRQLQSTVVVVSADHGRSLGRGGMYGHATALSEEQIRVPLVIAVPGFPSASVEDVVGGIDVTSTILFLAGADDLQTQGDGLNLLPTLVGGSLPERALFSELHNDDTSNPAIPRKLQAAIRFPHKLILDEPRGVAAVYNIVSDPLEERPLSGQLARQMTQETLVFFNETTHPRSRFGARALEE